MFGKGLGHSDGEYRKRYDHQEARIDLINKIASAAILTKIEEMLKAGTPLITTDSTQSPKE